MAAASGGALGSGSSDGDRHLLGLPASVWVAIISALAAIVSSYFAIDQRQQVVQVRQETQQQKENIEQASRQINQLSGTTPGPLEQGQKLCRVLQGKTWRDGMIVPQNWTVSLCRDYQLKTKGTGYQLGCIRPDGTTLGGEDGTFPSPNCGWQ